MSKCKLFFRNIYIVILLIAGLALSYFIVINGVALINTISDEQSKSSKEHSDNEKQIICYTGYNGVMSQEESVKYENRVIDFYKSLHVDSGKLFIEGYGISIAKAQILKNAQIVWTENTDFDKKLVSGRIPNDDEIYNKSNVVLISKEMQKYTVKREQSTQILLNNTYYTVIGVYETNDISELRSDVCFFKSTFSSKQLQEVANYLLKSGRCALRYCEDNTDNGYNGLINDIRKNGFDVDEDGINEVSSIYNKKAKLNKAFIMVLFVFCLINCMVISNVWVQSRMRELVIRKTMGYSMFQIEKTLVFDLIKYSIVAFIFALILQITFTFVTSGNTLKSQYFGTNTVYILLSMALVIAVSLIIPLIKIKNTIPARKIS